MQKGGTPLEIILSKVDYTKTAENQYQARCPAHQDDNPSLSITEEEPRGKVLLHCHAGCDTKDILRAIGLSMKDLFPHDAYTNHKAGGKPEISAAYDYIDDQGELIYQVVRYTPKDFRQRRPTKDGGWAWDIKDIQKVPYRLPELIEAKRAGRVIFIVEGEKDVDNLKRIGITATTNSGGAEKWGPEHSKWLEGADVVIIPDNDEAGDRHASKVSQSLQGVAKSIKVLRLPGLPPKGDVSDWLKAGGRASTLYELVDQIKVITPEEKASVGDPLGCSDLGNARRFVRKFGDKVKYCSEWGSWLIYDGKRWVLDKKLQVEDMAKSIPLDIYREVAGVAMPDDRVRLSKHAQRSESAYSIKEMLKLAASDPSIAVTHDLFDKDRWLLNVDNGTVNLITGELLPHNQKHLITKLAPVKFDPFTSSELWQNFLNDVTGGNEEFVRFLQKAVGYSMTGDTSEEVLFFIYGPTATGKSTFLEAVKNILGEYNKTADFESFLQHGKGNSHSDDIAALEGARMVVSVEVNEGKRLAEGLIKQITSGDPVPCRPIYGRSYSYYPQMKLWLAANHKPRVSAEDGAMWRRILTLPFDKTVPEERRDKTLKKKLKDTENVGPAILRWMVQGCIIWQQEGLNPPSVVKEATEDYKKSQDIIGEFIEDVIEFCEGERLPRATVYQEYKDWCDKNGERPASQAWLTQKLHERGWKDAPRGRQRCFGGVKLKNRYEEESTTNETSDGKAQSNEMDLKQIGRALSSPIDCFNDNIYGQLTNARR